LFVLVRGKPRTFIIIKKRRRKMVVRKKKEEASLMDTYRNKVINKDDSINSELLPPSYFLHSGNYALNKLMTGNFAGGLPEGRLVMFSGHSSSGKSLVAASALAENIREGGYGFAIDSETALDNDFMRNCGVDVDSPNYQYIGVDGIKQATAQVNKILKLYRETGSTTRAIIVVDSLNMLMTDTEITNVEKTGIIKGDQGQQSKQIKATLKTWMHSASGLPVTIICTQQPYVEQNDIKAKDEPWAITESWKFAFSQIIVFEKLLFKTQDEGHLGFTLKAKSYKNRFAREKQVIKIEIPFDNGVDEFSGLIEIAEEFGVVTKNGGWYTPKLYEGPKFQRKKAEADIDFMNTLLEEIKKVDDDKRVVHASLEEYVTELDGDPSKVKSGPTRRKVIEEKAAATDDDTG
jgi:recombination protein RecA